MEGPIGFIGVGAMGSSIASRLVRGHKLIVSDKNPAAAEDLVAHGATFAPVEELASVCRVIFLCLPGPQNVTGLLLGPDGLASRLTPGSIVIDITSSTPATDAEVAAALKERGVRFVDSPIAGGVRRAREGTAVLMVGASDEDYAEVAPLLQDITSDARHVGPVGAGHAMKLVNNLLNACNRFAALEVIRLGVEAGLRQDVVVDVVNRSSGRNYTTEVTYPQLLSGETYLPQGFTLDLMLKDVRLANELAEQLGHETPIGHLAQSFVEKAIERFGGRADQSQMMAQWYESGSAGA